MVGLYCRHLNCDSGRPFHPNAGWGHTTDMSSRSSRSAFVVRKRRSLRDEGSTLKRHSEAKHITVEKTLGVQMCNLNFSSVTCVAANI